MNAIGRACATLALVAGIAATPPPVYTIAVYARGAPVNAKFVADGVTQTGFVPLGKTLIFDYDNVPGKLTFEIAGCGRTQSKTIVVPSRHPGASFTIHANCLIEIGSR
ncbi:MAG TPA: hypothetical protein VIG46_13390 [Candidatus Baltobacteraceae bacterium]|jgi:hypothetical protein